MYLELQADTRGWSFRAGTSGYAAPWVSFGWKRGGARLRVWFSLGSWRGERAWGKEVSLEPIDSGFWGHLLPPPGLEQWVRESIIRELERFLPRTSVNYVVVHGEVVKIVEAQEPSREGGNQIGIEGLMRGGVGGTNEIFDQQMSEAFRAG